MEYLTAGESHGKEMTVIINNFPAGLKIDIDYINTELKRRQSGYGRGARMQIETDQIEITAGVRFGKTTGAPIAFKIQNRDWQNWQEKMSVLKKYAVKKLTLPRPGHSDFAGLLRFADDDIRNILERSSARETAAQVAVGAIAKIFLKYFDIEIFSHTISIGELCINKKYSISDLRKIYFDDCLRCVDKTLEKKMIDYIEKIKKKKDTIGGIFEVIAINALPGLGSFIQSTEKLDAKLAAAIIAIQGVKAIEFGAGFYAAKLSGSKFHDAFDIKNNQIIRTSNNAGGIEAGMTNGMPIVLRAFMKPIPTLLAPLQSVDLQTFKIDKAIVERSDVCVVPAAGVVAEAAVARVLTAAILTDFGRDNIKFILNRYTAKKNFIKKKYKVKLNALDLF